MRKINIFLIYIVILIYCSLSATAIWQQERYDSNGNAYNDEVFAYSDVFASKINHSGISSFSPLAYDLDEYSGDEIVTIGGNQIAIYNEVEILAEKSIGFTPTTSGIIYDIDDDGTPEMIFAGTFGGTAGGLAIYNYSENIITLEKNITYSSTTPIGLRYSSNWKGGRYIIYYDSYSERVLYSNKTDVHLVRTIGGNANDLPNYAILGDYNQDGNKDYCFWHTGQSRLMCVDETGNLWLNASSGLDDFDSLAVGNYNGGNYDFFITGADTCLGLSCPSLAVLNSVGTQTKLFWEETCGEGGKTCTEVDTGGVIVLDVDGDNLDDACFYWISDDNGGADNKGSRAFVCYDVAGSSVLWRSWSEENYGIPENFPNIKFIAAFDNYNDGTIDFLLPSLGLYEYGVNDDLGSAYETFPVSSPDSYPIIADTDGDGIADIVGTDGSAGNVSIYKNIYNNSYPEIITISYSTGNPICLGEKQEYTLYEYDDVEHDSLRFSVLCSDGTNHTTGFKSFNSSFNVSCDNNEEGDYSNLLILEDTFHVNDFTVNYTYSGSVSNDSEVCYLEGEGGSAAPSGGCYELGVSCETSSQCCVGVCLYRTCSKVNIGGCSVDSDCISGVCNNGNCKKPTGWQKVEAAKEEQWGGDTKTNNFISILAMLLISGAIIIYGRSGIAVAVGAGVFLVMGFFFAYVGWLSPFIALGLVLMVLVIFVLMAIIGGRSD